jgi:hypothetical protein
VINLRSVAALVIVTKIINGVSEVKSVLLAVAFSVLAGCAGYQVVPESQRGYELVVELDGKTKIEVFDTAQEWFGFTFRSSQDVIQQANLRTGRIIAKAISTVYIDGGLTQVPLDFRYQVVVDAKDGKARIKFGQYSYADYGTSPEYAQHVEPLNAEMKALAHQFSKHMKDDVDSVANDDW